MSISPTDDKVPASSSSSAPPRILVFPHGSSAEQQGLLELEACVAVSTPICTPQSAADAGTGVFDTGVTIPGDYCNSSQKVNGSRKQDAKKVSYGQRSATSEKWQSTDGISASPKRSDQRRSAQFRGKHRGYICARPDQMDTSNSQNNVVHSGGRKNQPISGNHLLNFHFDPITRPQPRMAPPKRQQKIRPYNKDLFLQANYKFFLLDTGDYVIGSMDPDKMLQWDDVICVKYSTPFQVHCPICLEHPISAQITSCGHIYCFPCILQYLLMGEEDHQGDYWKKCPLCFMMISIKDLYTVFIDNVKAYNVGDHINFTLLTRTKDSSVPRQWNYQRQDTLSCSSYELSDSFSKFTLTSDVDLSVREAKQDLSEWLAKAESGLVDDLEKLPYVCAALEQLDQRIKNWAEHRSLSPNPSLSSIFSGSPLSRARDDSIPRSSVASVNVEHAHSALSESSVCKDFIVKEDVQDSFQVGGQAHLLPTSSNDNRAIQKQSFGCKDANERDSYFFYQAIDGQHVILHPLNMKCLLHHYKNYESLPDRIGGRIVQLETVTQSEAARKRYRFLSHFSLTTIFQLCEIDLSDVLPANSLSPYVDEIKKREKQRKHLARKEQEEKDRAEAVAFQEMPISHDYRQFSCNGATFSLDDFEALGNSAVPSTSPPTIGEKKLFSHVTKLGFASGHDSPVLRANEVADVPGNVGVSGEGSTVVGQRATTLSFASVTSAAKTISPPEAPRMDGLGKKGKKPTRVLMSTTGGRRY